MRLESAHITTSDKQTTKYNEKSMGLLSEGSPLSWEETKKLSKHVREHGIEQFINLYRRLKNRTGDVLKWGDEVSVFFSLLLNNSK